MEDEKLLKLVEGQASAAEQLRLQNIRLFGGDGQVGALQFLIGQHGDLVKSLNETRIELAQKVESTRTELAANVESARKELAQRVESTRVELATNVEGTRKELAQSAETTRKELARERVTRDTKVDHDIDDLNQKHLDLNSKVNWSIGMGAGIGSAASFVLGWLGIRHGG